MDSNNRVKTTVTLKRYIVLILTVVIAAVMTDLNGLKAEAITYAVPTFAAEQMYDSDQTHPYNEQTNTIILHWNKTNGAARYQLFMKGGSYSNWQAIGTTSQDYKRVSDLDRGTAYQFKIRAVYDGNNYSAFSPVQTISTAKMDYDYAGWQAMCRIVYHEVGRAYGTMWDKPIVYVADCVINRYVAAKYENDPLWAPYYRYYSNIQQVIYNSGNFMSDAGLTNDGCSYANVAEKVKLAVWGAVSGQTVYQGIANDNSIYYWCNRSYYTTGSKIAYTFSLPWGGYFYIWYSYWG